MGNAIKVCLIAGLGNPGLKYKNTRHNAGFQVVQHFGKQMGVQLTGQRFQSRNAQAVFQRRKLILLCPQTFMNLSGVSIKACVDYFKIDPGAMLVVHDDLDLPLGRIKIVRNGGAGGHKGILSTIRHMGTSEFARLKIGIGRPRHMEEVEDYVLSPVYPEDRATFLKVIEAGVEACESFLLNSLDQSMNHFNHLNLAES